MTAVLTVKTQRKRILCIYRTDYQLSRNGINLSASKTCYITSIFAHILRLIIQNRLHLLLKELLHSKFNAFMKFIAKSTYRLLKRPLKKIDRNTRTRKTPPSELPGTQNAHYICKPEEGWYGQPKSCYKKQYTLS